MFPVRPREYIKFINLESLETFSDYRFRIELFQSISPSLKIFETVNIYQRATSPCDGKQDEIKVYIFASVVFCADFLLNKEVCVSVYIKISNPKKNVAINFIYSIKHYSKNEPLFVLNCRRSERPFSKCRQWRVNVRNYGRGNACENYSRKKNVRSNSKFRPLRGGQFSYLYRIFFCNNLFRN